MAKNKEIEVSVIVPVTERHDDLCEIFAEFSEEIKKAGKSYEFIFVVDTHFDGVIEDLKKLKEKNKEVRIFYFPKTIGEATALSVGFDVAKGELVFTLSAYWQVEAKEFAKLFTSLENGYDLVVTRRFPRIDPKFNQVQSRAFHWIVKKSTGVGYSDMSCGLRGFKKKVLQEINIYGDLHRFIPLLAGKQGFKIEEINVKQSKADAHVRVYPMGSYIRRLLDILTIFFLVKFTKKPLRFFGLVGLGFSAIGLAINLYLLLFRLFGFGGIAGRPLLLLGALLMVLGIQSLSIGLIGEIIIFTHAREIKEYQVEEVI